MQKAIAIDTTESVDNLKELIKVASTIIKCHQSHKKGGCLEKYHFISVICSSYRGNVFKKTKSEVSILLQLFNKIIPDFFSIKQYGKDIYFIKKDNNYAVAPVTDLIKARLMEVQLDSLENDMIKKMRIID